MKGTANPSGGAREQRGPGRTPRISRDLIADAAIALATEHGMDALTLQGVASRLGVKHSALYRHVAGRDELLRVTADRFVELANWPEPVDDWRAYLRNIAQAIEVECGRVPGMMDLIYNKVWPLPSALLALAKQSAEHLTTLGFSPSLALVAADLVADLAAEARVRGDQFLGRSEGWGEAARQTLPDGADEAERAKMEAMLVGSIGRLSSLKLEIVLDGIQAQLVAERDGIER